MTVQLDLLRHGDVQGGAIQGQYRGARATYDEAVASYDQTVVTAYQRAER